MMLWEASKAGAISALMIERDGYQNEDTFL